MLWVDYLCGGQARYTLAGGDYCPMAIPDQMRKCVVFVGHEVANQKMHIGGSAFWVIRQVEGTNFAYLVTARHCIDEIIKAKSETVQLRVNFKDGLAAPVATKTMDWKFHKDPAVDVAVLQRELPIDFDHLGWVSSWFYNAPTRPRFLREPALGIGDDIFVIGLFSQRRGKAKNIPIVRMGSVAAMPDDGDPISTEQGPMVAYLVETHSMGGLSGSPVFTDILGSRHGSDVSGPPAFYLIGLIHGHFPSDTLDTDTAKNKDDDKLNTGIAVVVPCERISEAIDYNFKHDEEEAVAKAQKKAMPIPDVRPNIAVEPFTQTDFEQALKKVSQRVSSQSDSKKK
jgi:hypothetical protein